MDKLIEELLQDYRELLQKGTESLNDYEKGTVKYKIQLHINRIWKIIINDLGKLADKINDENKN